MAKRKPREYTNLDREKAIQLYGINGSVSKVSRELNIPWSTVKEWISRPENAETVVKVREESKIQFADRASEIIEQGLDLLARRISTALEHMALENLRSYATQEAQKATYRDASQLATFLNNTKRNLSHGNMGMKAGAVAMEGVLPFTKTPVNIVKRGVEYSPIGLLNGLKSAAFDVKSGKVSASEAIDKIASGMTGTGILALGMWLMSVGLISGGNKEEKKEQDFDRLQGEQNYALNFGGKSYTLDWAAPASLPLFVGVELYNVMQGENPDKSISALLNSMTKLTEPMVEMSMLQGLNNAFKAVRYGDAPLSDIAIELGAGYVSQGVPTLSGQVARTIDPVRRTTYIDKNSQIPQFAQKFIQKQQAKIPGLSQGLMPYIDQWGRTQENPSLGNRAAQNFLSPGYYSENRTTPVDTELNRLYSLTGEKTILPGYAEKSITVDGEKINLTAKQYQEYATAKGQKSHELLDGLIKSEQYKNMGDAGKIEVITKLYEYSTALAKVRVSDYKLPENMIKALKAEHAGIKPYDYFATHEAQKGIESDKDKAGNAVAGTKSIKSREEIDKLNPSMSFEKREELYKSFGVGLSEKTEKTWSYPEVQKAVGSKENYYKVQELISTIKADKDEHGASISGTAKSKEIEAIAKELNVSTEKAEAIHNELVTFKHDVSEMTAKQQQSWQALKAKNMSEKDYIKYVNQMQIVTGRKDANGKTIQGSVKENRYNKLREDGMDSAHARYFLSEVYGYKW